MGTHNGHYFGADAAATSEYIASIEGRPVTKGADTMRKAQGLIASIDKVLGRSAPPSVEDPLSKAQSAVARTSSALDGIERGLAEIERTLAKYDRVEVDMAAEIRMLAKMTPDAVRSYLAAKEAAAKEVRT
jgi:hypothetical protein